MSHVSRNRAVEWQRPISFLPRALREPRRPLRALAVAWITIFIPTVALGAVTTALMPKDAFPVIPMANATIFWMLVVFAPVVETLLMGAALVVLRRLVSPTWAVLLSALGWGIAHSAMAPAWGLVIWWPFVVFSTLFLTWRSRSFWAALGIAAASHALHNLLPSLLLVSGLGN